MQHQNPRRAALLVVDMQVGLFHGPEQPHARERVLAAVQKLIQQARTAEAPIFAARHTGPAGSPIEAGSPLWQLLPELDIDAVIDTVFDKTRPSCFLNTPLAAKLADAGVRDLVICGMKTQYCIDATCRIAAELGFQPVLVADAHTTMDTAALSASAIIAHHNATLQGPFARVINTADVQF
ncbi:Streptothricin hydrolase [Andreprevotia sp. IGB-42]|uniref:cysteine hydrolase family protein n=1 Tax=Andreprevotia sp. IGB-42 TaxID=2497473 RepID=UPI00135A3DDD|nr:cysteine hydrolase family protein [Andreprevotia sp. IGB-42]KAF0813603.1 Streptothricin hydrolase [Andreprevotia sp. IGB-42]